MDLHIERERDVAVLELPFDELDAGNSPDFKRDVSSLVESQARLVFDLQRVRFVDSSGLGALLSCLRRVNEHKGELKLCGLSKPVRAVFELVRMHRIFDIHADREAAVAAFAGDATAQKVPA